MPTLYVLSVACDSVPNRSRDGLHYEAAYGISQIVNYMPQGPNGAPSPFGSGTGVSGERFEKVTMKAGGPGAPNLFQVNLFTDVKNVVNTSSFVRVSFRPPHDVAPRTNLPLSPLNGQTANQLLTGIVLNTAVPGIQTGCTNYGLPIPSYPTLWTVSQSPLARQEGSYEVTIEVVFTLSVGEPMYYKVDPEMEIDF